MGSVSSEHLGLSGTTSGDVLSGADDTKEPEQKQLRPVQWATLDELLDKLLFLAVSGDGKVLRFHAFANWYSLAAITRSDIHFELSSDISEIRNSSKRCPGHAKEDAFPG